MESRYTELALNGSKNECARTDIVFLPISEVCDGAVSHDTNVLSSLFPKEYIWSGIARTDIPI